MPRLFTIGYATKPLQDFIGQLKQYRVDVVADIRSVPYSKIFHDYHREAIAQSLKQSHIQYVYLGEELGPRSKDDDHYDSCGQVQFDRLMQSRLFLQGIERLQTGIKKEFSIALMCAEKDPAICHRSLLVAWFFYHVFNIQNPEGVFVDHIDHNGKIESQPLLEQRLVVQHKLENDLFMTPEEQLQEAYQRQLKKYAYVKNRESEES